MTTAYIFLSKFGETKVSPPPSFYATQYRCWFNCVIIRHAVAWESGRRTHSEIHNCVSLSMSVLWNIQQPSYSRIKWTNSTWEFNGKCHTIMSYVTIHHTISSRGSRPCGLPASPMGQNLNSQYSIGLKKWPGYIAPNSGDFLVKNGEMEK